MFNKKPVAEKPKSKDIYETQENPIVISQPLSNMQIIVVGNLEEDDEYKTQPFRPDKKA